MAYADHILGPRSPWRDYLATDGWLQQTGMYLAEPEAVSAVFALDLPKLAKVPTEVMVKIHGYFDIPFVCEFPPPNPSLQSAVNHMASVGLLQHCTGIDDESLLLNLLQPRVDNNAMWPSEIASMNGHLETLQWILGHGGCWTGFTLELAARNGHLHVLRWAHSEGEWYDYPCSHEAAINGHLHVLKWMHETEGFRTNLPLANYAARGGHLEVLKWLRAHGAKWDYQASDWAAKYGELAVLKWIRQNGGEFSDHVADWAAANGHLETLRWLRENGGGWSHWAADEAARNGHFAVLRWILENGGPSTGLGIEAAEANNHTRIAEWLRAATWRTQTYIIPRTVW